MIKNYQQGGQQISGKTQEKITIPQSGHPKKSRRVSKKINQENIGGCQYLWEAEDHTERGG